MLTWEYTFLDTCFIIFQLYTKISILEVGGRAFPPTEENLYFPWHCPGNTGLNKKLTLKAEFSSLGINTVILFPATFSILLDEEKNVLKCRDVEHIWWPIQKLLKGIDANKRIWSYRTWDSLCPDFIQPLLLLYFPVFFFPDISCDISYVLHLKSVVWETETHSFQAVLSCTVSQPLLTESDLLLCLPIWNLLHT